MFVNCLNTQIEQASKIETEDLLGQQFTGKKVDKESVALLRSLLNCKFNVYNSGQATCLAIA